MKMDNIFHYPPELMNLLINTIPRLNKSKEDVFLFFQGAGVPSSLMQVPFEQWKQNKDSINKFEITRQVLTKLNESGDRFLRERREVLKRVVEFEAFSSCWANDQLIAKGLVAEIRDVVNKKDSFTRMANERESERKESLAKKYTEIEKARKKKEKIQKLKDELFVLFSEKDKQKRGKKLENVLNSLFCAYGILVREAFTLTGDDGEGVLEQIDGVVEVDGHLYFVEMKWWSSPIGVSEISQHLIRVYHRAESRAIIISASNFTSPAVSTCKDALQQKVVVLCTLHEIVLLLEREGDLLDLIRTKVNAAVIDRKPYFEVQT
jgi:hypothetical protein